MKSILQVLVFGIFGSLIGTFLYENGLSVFGIIIREYPYQSFVVLTLTLILTLLTFLTVKVKGS